MSTTVAYLRASTGKQDLNNQKLEILEYARQKDLKVGYYLRHRSLVEEYLAQRRQEEDRVRRQNESRFPTQGIRDRLLSLCQQQTG